jgi:hypothetical protein
MKTIKRVFFVTSFFALCFSQAIFACQTSPANIPFCHSYESADAIFIGVVSESKPFSKEINFGKTPYSLEYNHLTFTVKETLKGTNSSFVKAFNQTEIFTSCDKLLDIKIGQTWVVFMRKDNEKEDFYITNNSFIYNETKEHNKINDLRKITRGESDNGIYGQISANYPASLISRKDYKVVAEGNGQMLITKMDEYGRFTFSPLAPGTYKIKAFLPFEGYVQSINSREMFKFDNEENLYSYELQFTTKDNRCNYFQISTNKVENSSNLQK